MLAVHVSGNSAFSHEASLSLHSEQTGGGHAGWVITKKTTDAPNLEFEFHSETYEETTPFKLYYDGDITLASGVKVNKILDEDTLVSNDPKALITQQSVKAYVDNNTYSQTDLDNGQLDNRYYTETETDAWRIDNPHTASGITYNNTSWEVSNTKDALDKVLDYTENIMGTGRINPQVTISGVNTTTLHVNAGEGFINYDGLHKYVVWDYTTIDTQSFENAAYYVYVDSDSVVHSSTSLPNKNQTIYLGYIYFNSGFIRAVFSSYSLIDNYYNRMNTYIENLGLFLSDDGGSVTVDSVDSQKIVSSACKIQAGTSELQLTEVGSAHAGSRMWNIYFTSDIDWKTNTFFFMPNGYNGKVPTDRWNDTTGSGLHILNDEYTFTQYYD